MALKKELLKNSKLYLVLDRSVNGYDELFEIAQQAILGGVDIIQLRDKSGTPDEILAFSKCIKDLTRDDVLYIINDHVDLVLEAKARSDNAIISGRSTPSLNVT